MKASNTVLKVMLLALFLSFVLASLPQSPFYVPIVQGFSGSNGEFGNWTWNSGTKLMTVVANATANAGNTEANAYNVQDIVNAINYYGWSAGYNRSTSGEQFEFYFRAQISDGTITTWFVDYDKEISFASSVWVASYNSAFYVKANGHLRFGILVSQSLKIGSRGISLYIKYRYAEVGWLVGLSWVFVENGGDAKVYASHFIGDNDYGGTNGFNIYSYGHLDMYQTVIQGVTTPAVIGILSGSDVDLFDATLIATSLFPYGGTATVNKISFYNINMPLWFWLSYAGDVKNVYARSLGAYAIDVWQLTTDHSIINGDLENWNIYWEGGSTAKIYRKYESDLTIQNSTLPIPNANVTVTYSGQGGGAWGSWLTNSTGQISTKTFTRSFYQQSTGNAENLYAPFNLTITASGYQTYVMKWTPNQKESYRIALLPEIITKTNPVARFNNTISAVHVNENVFLNGSISLDPDGGSLTNYSWNFGDGNTTSGNYPIISHKWSTASSYKINLTVTDDESATNFFVWTINVTGYLSPIARFTYAPSNPQPSQTVSFNGSTSYDPDGSVTNYYWTFGDGISQNGSSSTATHAFAAGTYSVTLEVTDNQNLKNSFTQTITVLTAEIATTGGPPPEIFPEYDLLIQPLPEYMLPVPWLSETFQVDIYLHNKGQFGKETSILFWIEDQNKEKIYEKSQSLFVNPLETRDLTVSLTKPAETGTYTLYAKITSQTRTSTTARQSFQIYNIVSWLVGPGVIVTVLIGVVLIVLIFGLHKKYVAW